MLVVKKKTDCGNLSDEATKEDLPLLKYRERRAWICMYYLLVVRGD